VKFEKYISIIFILLPCLGSSQSDSLEYSLLETSRDTTFTGNRKLELSFEFPTLSNSGVTQIINSFLMSNIFEENNFSSTDELWFDFIREYSSVVEEGPGHSASWLIDRSIKVILNKHGLLSLEFAEMQFTGGAHPNSKIVFTNYDVENNKIVSLSDLFIMDV